MLRFHVIASADAAIGYYGKADGGYYLAASDLHREWGGDGAKLLNLTGPPDFNHFKHLIAGNDPHTGEQLTARILDNRIPGWDVTASVPKGVTVALESGDDRIQQALWDANREAMADLQSYATTRVRKSGQEDDRVTGNLVWFSVEHPETRPAKSDNYPDPDRHIHNVVMNLTYDKAEGEWKAVKFRPIMDLRKYFDRSFDLRLSSKLADLGYEIETKYKPDEKGGKRYFSWDIKGIPDTVIKSFSRRSAEVEALADELGVQSPQGKDKLGATSRQYKRKDLTLEDYRKYWQSKISPEETNQIASTLLKAMAGRNPKPEPKASQAVSYAIDHQFYRHSVVDYHDLAVTAMERAMGGAKPEDILPEARKQGLLLKNGLATTQAVLDQESRVVAFARDGRGTCRAMGSPPATAAPLKLSTEQLALCKHIWESHDRVIMIEGDAGTGKTQTMQRTIPGIDAPGVFLAPSASASRGTLREKGFTNADTIAMFNSNEKFREQARNGYIYIDEAPLAGLDDIDQVFRHANELNARIIVQGDRKQHRSFARGNLFELLDKYAGLPIGRLAENWRQTDNDYKKAVNAIAKGDILAGYDKLSSMGWIRQTQDNQPLVDDYMAAVARGKSVLVIAPTHKEGDEITGEIRDRMRREGRLGKNEKTFDQLVPLPWSEAEKGDRDRYDGTEILQYVRNSGPYRAGQRIGAADWLDRGSAHDDQRKGRKPKQPAINPKHFAVYAPGRIEIAPGDLIRITANGKATGRDDKEHGVDNGAVYAVKGFRKHGERFDIELSNGWFLDGTKPLQIAHAYVSTSHASQGKTVDQVFVAMGGESRPAMNAEQWYVSLSRGRDSATVYTNLRPHELREAIQKSDTRMTATELMKPPEKPKRKNKLATAFKRVREAYRALRQRAEEAIQPERSMGYER